MGDNNEGKKNSEEIITVIQFRGKHYSEQGYGSRDREKQVDSKGIYYINMAKFADEMDVESEREGRDIGGHSGFWLEKWKCERK